MGAQQPRVRHDKKEESVKGKEEGDEKAGPNSCFPTFSCVFFGVRYSNSSAKVGNLFSPGFCNQFTLFLCVSLLPFDAYVCLWILSSDVRSCLHI